MSKPEPIIINFSLGSWSIDYTKNGFDIGEDGPDLVSYKVSIYWVPDVSKYRFGVDNAPTEEYFRTLQEAKNFLKKEVGIDV